jgi:hypothetical protein
MVDWTGPAVQQIAPAADQMQVRSLRRAIALLAAAVAAVAVGCGTAAQAAEPGVVVNGPAGLSSERDGFVSSLGVRWVRGFVPWNTFEQTRGHLNESLLHGLEAGIDGLPAGSKVILDVVDSPQWASGSSNPATPPHDPADYARFAGEIAKRLAGRVTAYEIWNEEDASLWWSSGPDPAAYADLLKAAYPAIKTADSKATVALGGMTGNDYEFLSAVYAHGAKGHFDAVAVHTDSICNSISPYNALYNSGTDRRINRWAFLGYRTVHETMLAHGDDSPIWMTELGWSTSKEVCNAGAGTGHAAGGVSEETQALYLRQAYHCLARDPYVQVGLWYGLQETEPFGSPRGSYGLLDQGLSPKPAYDALAAYARNGDQLTEKCGIPGPSVRLLRPKTGTRYTNTLPISVTASGNYPVYLISLYDDGHIIRNFYVHDGLPTLRGHMVWYGARLLKPGKHRLTARAIDMRNNVGTTSITIVRAVAKRHKRHGKHHGKRHGKAQALNWLSRTKGEVAEWLKALAC